MFEFKEEHVMLRNTIRKLVEKEFTAEWARKVDAEDRFPREVLPKLAELGTLGLTISEEYGGMGRDLIAAIIVLEELSRRSIALAWVYVASVFFGGEIISHLGSEEQKRDLLPRLVSGEIVFAYALTEPNFGSDTASITTFAEKKGDQYVINGAKTFISGASAGDYMLLLTRTSRDVPKHQGLSMFIVDAKAAGISTRPIAKVGVHGSDTCEVVLENVVVSENNMLGGPQNVNKGWKQLLSTLDVEHIHIAAEAVGLAQGAWDETFKYTTQRIQFDQPISKYQVVQHMMVDGYTELEAARWFMYYTADLAAKDKPCWKESAMAKMYATEVAKKIALNGVQLHGGYGYTMEYDIQRYMRDSLVLTIGGGTTQVLKNIIAKSLGF